MQSVASRRGSVSSMKASSRSLAAPRVVPSAVCKPVQARCKVTVKASAAEDFLSKVASSVLAVSVLVSAQAPCLPAQAADNVIASNLQAGANKLQALANGAPATPTLGEAAERRFGDQAGVLAEVKGNGADLGGKIRGALDTPSLQSKNVLGNAGQQAQQKVSSDINSAKGAAQSAFGGGNPLQSILGGNPGQAAQQKVGGDLNSAKNAVQNAVGGSNPLQSIFGGNPGQQAQQKVNSGFNSAKGAVQSAVGGSNPLQSILGSSPAQQAQQKVGGDINSAKNAVQNAVGGGNPLQSLFGGNPGQKVQNKVSGDINSAKNATNNFFRTPLLSILTSDAGQQAQQKVGNDINSAKNAVQNAVGGANPLQSLFGGGDAGQQAQQKVSSDINNTKNAARSTFGNPGQASQQKVGAVSDNIKNALGDAQSTVNRTFGQ